MSTVGVIGTGSFGQKRVQTLQRLSDKVEQIVIFDQDSSALQKIAQGATFPTIVVASSIAEMLANPDIQAVLICTPHHLHATLAHQALTAGKHVLCEKPLSVESTTTTNLVNLAQKQQLVLATGSNHRHFPSVQKALKIVQSRQLGEVLTFHGSIGTNGQRIQDTWFWRQTLAKGGTFSDNGHHLVDLALLFCGSFDTCLGHSSTRYWQGAEVEDYALAVYERQSTPPQVGYEAVLRSSWRQPVGYLDIEIWGNRGWLKLAVGETETLKWRTASGVFSEDFSDYPKASLEKELQAFFQNIEQPSNYNSDHLLQLTRMIEAFYSSQDTGRKVMLRS